MFVVVELCFAPFLAIGSCKNSFEVVIASRSEAGVKCTSTPPHRDRLS